MPRTTVFKTFRNGPYIYESRSNDQNRTIWFNYFKKAFDILGIDVSDTVLNDMFDYDHKKYLANDMVERNSKYNKLAQAMDWLMRNILIQLNDPTWRPDNFVKLLRRDYFAIADVLSEFLQPLSSSTYFANGKQLFSNILPSRITDIAAHLNRDDKEWRKKYYDDVDWFRFIGKKNIQLNYWLGGNIKLRMQKFRSQPKSYLVDTKEGESLIRSKKKRQSNEIKTFSKDDFLESISAMYEANLSNPSYPLPNLSDSGNLLYIEGERFNEKDLYEYFTDLAEQEINRILNVQQRAKTLSSEEKIKNFDINGNKLGGGQFCFLTGLNDFRFAINKKGETVELTAAELYASEENYNHGIAIKFPNTDYFTDYYITNSFEGTKRKVLKEAVTKVLDDAFNEFSLEYPRYTKDFFLNEMYAYSNIVQLTVGDLAYYKYNNGNTITDFQKRFKGIFGRTNRMAVDENENMQYIVLEDEELKSEYYNEVSERVDELVKNGVYSNADGIVVKKVLEKITNTDGQGLISPSALAKVYESMGNVNPILIDALRSIGEDMGDIISPNILLQNLSLFINPIKPFVQTNRIKPNHDGTAMESIPTQIKNSELLLMPLQIFGGPMVKSPKLRALYRIMKDYNIDRIQFVSTVKSGLQGAININDLTDENDIYNKIAQSIDNDVFPEGTDTEFAQAGMSRGNVLQTMPYSAYGIQVRTETNEERATQGTQMTKTMMSNLRVTENYDIQIGKTEVNLNGDEVKDVLITAITESVDRDAKKINDTYSDPEKANKEITRNFQNGTTKDNDIADGFAYDKDTGEPVIPYNEPCVESSVTTSTAANIRKSITKRKIKGKTLIQGSSFGVNNQLKCVFEVKDGNKSYEITREYFEKHNKNKNITYEQWANKLWKSGKIGLKYIEVYISCPDENIKKALTDENGIIDINKKNADGKLIFDTSLRDFIGYRIPTEGNCSIFNCHIADFLPNCLGETIIVPSEFIAITGSDFDIDKMFTMMYENKKTKDGRFVKDSITFSDKKDIKGSLQKASKKQVNNAFIDISKSIIRSNNSLPRNIHPSSYPFLKKLSYLTTILNNIGISQLEQGKLKKLQNIQEVLSMDESELESMCDEYAKQLTPMSLQSILDIHENNNAGKTLIGIYAVNTGLHNILMNVNNKVKNLHFIRIGTSSKNPNDIYSTDTFKHDVDREGRLISFNCGEFQASSKDNGKDPILYALGQNKATAPLANIMTLAGFTTYDIALFFNQPIVKDIVKEYNRQIGMGISFPKLKDIAYEIARTKYEYGLSEMNDEKFNSLRNHPNFSKVFNIYLDNMEKDIIYGNEEDPSVNDDYYLRQGGIGLAFVNLVDISSDMFNLSRFLRADTVKAGMPSTKEDIVKMLLTFDQIKENSSIQIEGFNSESEHNTINQIDYINKFIDAGLINPAFNIIFKQQPQIFELEALAYRLYGQTNLKFLSKDALKDLAKHLTWYEYSNFPFFYNNRERILSKDFVGYFQNLKNKHKELFNNNKFLNHFYIENGMIKFKLQDKTNKDLKEVIKTDYENLLYDESNSIRNLALELFVYSFHTSAFQFTYDGFSQYIPTAVKEAFPGYIEYTRQHYGKSINVNKEQDIDNFLDQYVFLSDQYTFPRLSKDYEAHDTYSDGRAENASYMSVYNTNVNAPMKLPQYLKIYKNGYKLCEKTNDSEWIYEKISDDVNQYDNDFYVRSEQVNQLNIFEDILFGETFEITDISDADDEINKQNLC